MIKTYVIDTNVLLLDPDAIFNFEDNNVVIPIGVIEELDRFKKDQSELGKNARHVSRSLDVLRVQGDLRAGVKIGSGLLSVRYNGNLNSFYKESNVDLHVIHIAQQLSKEDTGVPCIIVSRDINVRIRANALGISAESYESDKIPHSEIDSGFSEIAINDDMFDLFAERHSIDVDDLDIGTKFMPNHYLVIKRISDSKKSLLARVDKYGSVVKKLLPCPSAICLSPRNKEQAFVMDALLDNDIKLVCISGKAGTGKTILALGCGYYLTVAKKIYKRLLVSRPIFPMGKDIGFLPGDIDAKLDPWMSPIYDALDVINPDKSVRGRDLVDGSNIVVEPLTYIRGRSIRDQFLIIDECLSGDSYIKTATGKLKIKSIIDRIKNGEKIKVLSYNENSKTFEYKNVYNGKFMGEKDIFEVNFCKQKIKCSGDHKFLTSKGWKVASLLKSGDFLISSSDQTNQFASSMTEVQKQIILGSFLGDGGIDFNKYKFRLKVTHGIDQLEYNKWKSKFFKSEVYINKIAGYSNKPTNSFMTKYFANEFPESLPKNKTYCPKFVMDEIDERGLAIWFMDDGSAYCDKNGARIYTCSFNKESQDYIVNVLNEKFGIDCHLLYDKKNSGYYYISITKRGYENLCLIIDKYIHPDLRYKMINGKSKLKMEDAWILEFNNYGMAAIDKVVDTGKEKKVYDISVEDNNNFVVCSSSRGKNSQNYGIVAHNCQNLTSHEIKTIITRAGENTKVVLTGDIYQIDNPYIDSLSNGLSVVTMKMLDSSLSANMVLEKGVRSELAEEAANKL